MWRALSIFQTWLLSVLPAKQLWGCLLPVPTCRSSLPDWTPLINCQLDWLQVFIICHDWANLEANLNQACWETGERHSSSRPRQNISPGSSLHFRGFWLCATRERPQSEHWQTSGLCKVFSRTTRTTEEEFSCSKCLCLFGFLGLISVFCSCLIRVFTGSLYDWWHSVSANDMVKHHVENVRRKHTLQWWQYSGN